MTIAARPLTTPTGRHTRGATTGAMAIPVPRPAQRAIALLTHLIFWGSVLLYTLIFGNLSLAQYHAYLPHALDLGNMAQAFYNTAHGHPFRFLNMRAHVNFEAFGT